MSRLPFTRGIVKLSKQLVELMNGKTELIKEFCGSLVLYDKDTVNPEYKLDSETL